MKECGTCYYFHRDDQLPKSYGDCHFGDMIFGIHEHKKVCEHYKKWVFPKVVDEASSVWYKLKDTFGTWYICHNCGVRGPKPFTECGVCGLESEEIDSVCRAEPAKEVDEE